VEITFLKNATPGFMWNWEAYIILLPETLGVRYRSAPACRKVKNRGGYIELNT
jgi:hypothetical protein